MNEVKRLSSKLPQHRLSRFSVWKMQVQAHIECAPALVRYYGKKVLKYVGVEL